MTEIHCQCYLRKGPVATTAWIPEEFAVIGRPIKLRKRGGEWDDGWVVEEVGARRLSTEVADREQDWKKQRQASDI